MDWVKSLAPLIGSALGGPIGGAAAAFLADKLGLESSTVDSVTAALSSGNLTPEQVSSIKLAEINFKQFLESNKIDLEKLAVQDRQGARDMQGATKSNIPGTLAVIIVSGFFSVLVLMMSGILTTQDNQSLLILLGALSAGFGAVLNFYFGSSRGSQNKDLLLAQSTPTK